MIEATKTRDKMTEADVPLLVVVSGPPGAGKSTLARRLADELRLPLVAKDDFKELLFRSFPAGTIEETRRLGAAAWDALFHVVGELLGTGCSAIAEGNFTRPEPFAALPPARIVQLHLTAPPAVLLERYHGRPRHPGHQTEAYAPEIRARLEAGDWEPVDLPGRLIVVNTVLYPPDLEYLLRQIRAS
jgi:predicted kinase